MPRSNSGVYSQPTGTVPAYGDIIDETLWESAISDLGTEVTNSLDRKGRGAMQGNLPMGGYRMTGMGDPTQAQDAATRNYVQRIGVTPFDYGAKGDGTTDDSAAFNTALAALVTGGGGVLYLPQPPGGSYLLGSTILNTGKAAPILGAYGGVQLNFPSTTADCIQIGDGVTQLYCAAVKRVHVNCTGLKSAGGMLKLRGVNNSIFDDIIGDGIFNGIDTGSVNTVRFTNMAINMPNQTSGRGVNLYDNPNGSTRSDIIEFDNVTVQARNAGSDGMVWDGAVYGVHGRGLYMLGTKRGMQVINSQKHASNYPQFGFFYDFETDRALNSSVVINSGYHLEFHHCEISNTSGAQDVPYPQGGADTSTFQITQGAVNDVNYITIMGGHIHNCQQAALSTNGLRVTCIGTSFYDASKAGTGAFPVVYVGPNAARTKFIGCGFDGNSRASYPITYSTGSTLNWEDGSDYVSCQTNSPFVGSGVTVKGSGGMS